ncbi:helix-turn-helix domain-containing protein [Rhodococcus sp. 114MFTsu3.1]|uniref:helix-turn-helix domain-containing protein n=1 Tax=Rhodococcus sp. 114MFTsu3.1 TaxID=1172184 RepID=UPI0009DB8CEF
MFISEAHLRRLLADEGTSFRRIRDELRSSIAVKALRCGHPVRMVSYRLGFSDPRAFRRAFRRWTNTSPASQRNVGSTLERYGNHVRRA